MTFEKELTFLADILEVKKDSILLNTPLNCLENWDSINALSFMAQADEDYGIAVSAKDLEQLATVEELLSLLRPGNKA